MARPPDGALDRASGEVPIEASERVAEALRREPPLLDDVARARMERRLVGAIGTRRADSLLAPVPTPEAQHGSYVARWLTLAAAAGIVGAVVAAAATGWMLRSDSWAAAPGDPRGSDAPASGAAPGAKLPPASYEAVSVGEETRVVAQGPFEVGQTVRTRPAERWHVQVSSSRLDVAPRSEARFERLDDQEIRVRVSSGAVRVEFHPDQPRRQRMVIETDLARVEVLGTVFRVEVDGEGTRVTVERGTVRVVHLRTGRASVLRGGESLRVRPQEERVRPAGAPASPASTKSSLPPGKPAVSPSAGDPDAGTAVAAEPGASGHPSAAAGTNTVPATEPPSSGSPVLSDDVRFDLADTWIRQGRYALARHELYAVARTTGRGTSRARAWLRVADTYELQRRYDRAAEAYRRAAEAGPRTAQGLNALFALARVRERRLEDVPGARVAYRRYLELAPDGPLAAEASRRLCSLGDWGACR